ncbi:MAG: type II secretion protein F [Actinomycetota bacterium]|nr:type II secretion protein F [Actinomycetota bacterium]
MTLGSAPPSGVVVAALLVVLVMLLLPSQAGDLDVRVGSLWGRDEPVPDAHRARQLEVDDVAATMVLLAVALRSGCGEVEAVEAVARVSEGRVGADLWSVSAARRWGVDAERAWTAADPGWCAVARLLAVAGRAGVPPSRLLVDGSRDQRAAELAALDVAGARVGVRLVAPLGLAFLPAFCLTTVVPLVVAIATQVLG